MTRSVSSPHWLLCREYLLVDFEAIEVGPRTICRGSWICALGIAMDGDCEVLGWLPTNIDECMQSLVPSWKARGVERVYAVRGDASASAQFRRLFPQAAQGRSSSAVHRGTLRLGLSSLERLKRRLVISARQSLVA